jgi:mannose-1-phosphate guanylyltransferase
MISLVAQWTLFEATVRRLEGLLPPERILVVTVPDQVETLKSQAPQIPTENYLLEPAPRGTASVVGLAAVALQKRDPQATMIILPSDHFIRNRDLFHLLLRVAAEVTESGYLVTLGITPTYPATSYGYIQSGELLPEEYVYPVYKAVRFQEKPDETQARELLMKGNYSWNSGMFIWKADRILEEIGLHMPDLKSGLERIASAWETPEQEAVLASVWPDLRPETVDYGVMEHAENVAVLPASGLGWSDIGNWDSLFDVLLPDGDGNIVFAGHHIPLETHNSLVYGDGSDRLVVTIGVDDLIIVDTNDVLLVCRRDQAQKVRQVVANLKNSVREQYT